MVQQSATKAGQKLEQINQIILVNFANLHVSVEKEVYPMFPAGTEWLPDFSLNNSPEVLKPFHVLNAFCNLLYHIFVQK